MFEDRIDPEHLARTGEEIARILGRQIAEIRERRLLTIEDVARDGSLSCDQVACVERGLANVEELQKICGVLNLEIVMKPAKGLACIRELGAHNQASNRSENLDDRWLDFGGPSGRT